MAKSNARAAESGAKATTNSVDKLAKESKNNSVANLLGDKLAPVALAQAALKMPLKRRPISRAVSTDLAVSMMKVLVQKTSENSKELKYAHEGDSGIDLYSMQTVTLKPMQRELVGTGVKVQMPHGLEAQIRPKSGLAINHGITLLNSPGTIDSSYRGEIKVIVINFGNEEFIIEEGQKIAQMVFAKVEYPDLVQSKELQSTTRNAGGFGSTGL